MIFLSFLAGILILFLVAYALLKKMQPKTPATSTPTTQPKTKEYGWQVALIWVVPGLIAAWFLKDGIWAAAQSSPLIAGIFVLTLGVLFSWVLTMGRPANTEAANRFRQTMTILLAIVGITLALLAHAGVIGGQKSDGGPASAKPPDQVPTATTHKWQVDPDYTPKCMVWVSNDRFEVALSSNQTIETGVEIPSSGEYSIARVSGGEYFIKKKGKFFGLDRDFISLESLAEGQLILKSKNPVKLRVRLGS